MKFRIDVFTWDNPYEAASQHDITYHKTKKEAVEYGKTQRAENRAVFLLRKAYGEKYDVIQKIGR